SKKLCSELRGCAEIESATSDVRSVARREQQQHSVIVRYEISAGKTTASRSPGSTTSRRKPRALIGSRQLLTGGTMLRVQYAAIAAAVAAVMFGTTMGGGAQQGGSILYPPQAPEIAAAARKLPKIDMHMHPSDGPRVV